MENLLSNFPKDYVDLPAEKWHQLNQFIPPNEVCHYTSKETALEYIFYHNEIRLGNLNETNDPKETKTQIFQYTTQIDGRPETIYALDRFENIKVFCTCCHNHPSIEIINQENNFEDYKYGVSRSAMWAHYGDMHKGVCIIFDGKVLHENICKKVTELGGNPDEDVRCGFVRYDFVNSVVPNKGATEDVYSLIQNYELNFLRKSSDWKSEHEFRWIVAGKQQSNLLVSIRDAVKGIIVGSDFNDIYLPLLERKRKELNFYIGRIIWVNGRPEIRFH